MTEGKRLIIIDSNSIIHRAYHALPPLKTKKGELVNAVYGFLLVFFKAIREFQPDLVAACFDFPGPTFRHKKFKEYKAKRPPAPKELYDQVPKVKEILKGFEVPIFEKEGFEADDLIGTISKKFPKKQIFPQAETIILSGDLDTLQLVNSQTKVYLLKRGVKDTILYDESKVKERYGLNSNQLVDFKALRGDPSDNIPGLAGIGEKTATELIKEFGSLENLYREMNQKSEKTKKLKPKLKELLFRQKEQVFLSQALASIEKNVSIDFNLEKYHWGRYDKEKIIQFLKKLDFNSLINRLPQSQERSENHEKEKEEITGKNLRLW